MIPTYPLLIQEDVAQLQVAEKAARDKARADRLRLLRFLKEGCVASVSQAAEVLGYHASGVMRSFRPRCDGGASSAAKPPSR